MLVASPTVASLTVPLHMPLIHPQMRTLQGCQTMWIWRSSAC